MENITTSIFNILSSVEMDENAKKPSKKIDCGDWF